MNDTARSLSDQRITSLRAKSGFLEKNKFGKWEYGATEISAARELSCGSPVEIFIAGRWMYCRVEAGGIPCEYFLLEPRSGIELRFHNGIEARSLD